MRFLSYQSNAVFKTLLFVMLVAFGGASRSFGAEALQIETKTERPVEWAVKIDKSGLKNFHALSTNFYRGAQPSKDGMAALQALGVKTIINLRGFHSDKGKIGKLDISREHFRFNTWHAEDEDVVAFLKVATDTNRWPIFVHCLHGADRTGMMCAMYRMTVEGWTRDAAIREMTQGGYGFHPEWQNLIRYLRKVDIEKIKKAAGITSEPNKK